MKIVRSSFAVLGVSMVCILTTSNAWSGEKTDQPQPRRGFPGEALIKGLRATKGCLGVDSARWQSGKMTIAAWFENKAAVVRWYYSGVHRGAMTALTDGTLGGSKPLKHVKDENTPILVLATLTPAQQPKLKGLKMPISQISIELFAPLPGGAHVGGRLAPPTFRVPHMRGYTPKKKKSENKKQ